ncbi:MAG: dihydroorotate dehydrogenase electron transfer subunit [Bacillota bacterium]
MPSVVRAPIRESVRVVGGPDGRIAGPGMAGDGPGLFHRLRLQAPAVADAARPGQFVHVRCAPPGQWDPLLRRPLSLHRIDRSRGEIEVLFRVVGRGTGFLAGLAAGDEVDLIGPLGQGFPTDLAAGETAVLVAGGIGVAPLVALAEELAAKGAPRVAAAGAQTAAGLPAVESLGKAAGEVLTATDDGSAGHRGFVTEVLAGLLGRVARPVVYACGPEPMLRRVQAMLAEEGRPRRGYLSLETRMACGVGACLGCAVRQAKPGTAYYHVCHDGPVFAAEEVVLNG